MNAGIFAQPQANPPSLGEYILKIPQSELLDCFNKKLDLIKKKSSLNEVEIDKLQNLKQLIISRISGM